MQQQIILDRYHHKQDIFIIQRQTQIQANQNKLKSVPIFKKTQQSSLKQICKQIIAKFFHLEQKELHINILAQQLRVERRRIYDIINILEGLDIVRKKQKNVYLWKNADNFLSKLKFINNIKNQNSNCNQKIFCFENSNYSLKKKFLTHLSIDFLKRFYKENQSFSFKNILYQYQNLNENQDREKQQNFNQRTLRRVYDVINVFKALGLIEKSTQSYQQKKFVWREPKYFRKIKIKKLKNQNFDKENLKYDLPNSGFKVCRFFKNFDEKDLKRIMHVRNVNKIN